MLQISPVVIIPNMPCTHSFTYHWCDNLRNWQQCYITHTYPMLHNICLQTYTHLLSKEKRGDNRRCVDCSFFLDCTHSSRVMPYLHSSVFSSSGDGASFTFLQYNQNNKLSWRFRSSGMWCCCDGWTVPDVSVTCLYCQGQQFQQSWTAWPRQ